MLTKKCKKYKVLGCIFNQSEIPIDDYFEETCNLKELQKGIKKLQQDMDRIESITHSNLIDFMDYNMDYSDLTEIAMDYTDRYELIDDALDSYSVGELWDLLDEYTQDNILYEYLETVGVLEYIEDNTNNEDLLECILQYTNYSLRELNEIFKTGGNTRNETK